jgi:hypothetical protein
MSDWLNIDIPFSYNKASKPNIKLPAMGWLLKKKLGFNEIYLKKIKPCYADLNYLFVNYQKNNVSKYRYYLDEEHLLKNRIDANDPVLKRFYEYHDKSKLLEDFKNNHLDYIKYKSKSDKFEKIFSSARKHMSVDTRGLLYPGTALEVNISNKETKIYYVGGYHKRWSHFPNELSSVKVLRIKFQEEIKEGE